MKSSFSTLFALLFCLSLFAFSVPYSQEPIYTEANMLSGLQRVSPEDKAAERLSTKLWLWQEEHNLCFTFEAEIDSSFIPGPVSTRDASFKADYLRIQLITIPEAYYAYLFNFYATGNLFDAVRETGRSDIGFNTNYSYTSSINDNLWKVTGKIPLGELRFKQSLPYKWKIIVTRHHQASSEDFSLPWVLPKMQNDYFAKALDIELTHAVKRKLDITLKPYLVKSYDLVNKTDSFDPENIGMDFAFSPAQRTRLKLTFNPDFSDVPPDEAADVYNSKYPRYYTENRFFFTEDIDAFGVSANVFNSRKIIKPQLAFKATGNTKKLNWGVLGALDKEIVDNGRIRNYDDYFQVLSFIPQSKTLKLANSLVSRVNEDYYNHVFSSSYRWDYSQDVRISTWNAFSVLENDRKGDTEPLYGSSHYLSLAFTPGNWTVNPFASYYSKNMWAEAGYLNDRYYHKFGANVAWDSDESLDYISYQGVSLNAEKYVYYTQNNSESSVMLDYYINFRPQFGFSTDVYTARLLDLSGKQHEIWNVMLNGTFYRWQFFNLQVKYSLTDELVYALADTYLAKTLYANVWGTISQRFGYDLYGTHKAYAYPKGVLGDYGGLLPIATPLDNNYLVLNGELSYTPQQKLRIACGSGISTYEEYGMFSSVNLYGNLRFEFKPNSFFYCGFNSNQLQDIKSTYGNPRGHFTVDTANAYAKVAVTL